MQAESENKSSATNCVDCERYKQLGEVCVIEHGKKFLWEYCKDFSPEVNLPDYDELMKTVKQDMALERRKLKDKKKKEILARRKDRERIKREKLSLKRSKIAKQIWERRRKTPTGLDATEKQRLHSVSSTRPKKKQTSPK